MGKNNSVKIYTAYSDSPATTARLASEVALAMPINSVLSLDGDLGAGKTAFVRGFAAARGVEVDRISSPTFTLMHVYDAACGLKVYHFDVYRLGSAAEFARNGLTEYFTAGGICLIEWAAMIKSVLPDNCWKLCITKIDAAYSSESQMANFLLGKNRTEIDLSGPDSKRRLSLAVPDDIIPSVLPGWYKEVS